jgi:YHS domain-containing protein
VRIEFSARAWMLSAATGLVILPSMDVEVRAESKATESSSARSSGEPRKLIERPATRAAISTSKPARSLFPKLFSAKKSEPTVKLPPREPGDTRSEVQRHLDALYGREGREAPTLDIGQPVRPPQSAGLSSSASPQPKSSTTQSPSKGPIRQVSSNPFKRFFQKITPFRRAKNPNDERPEKVEPLPAAARREQLRLQQTPIAQPVAKSKPKSKAKPKPNLEPIPIPMSIKGVAARPALPSLNLLVPPAPAPADAVAESKAALEEVKTSVAPVAAAAADLKSKADEASGQLPEFLPVVELPQVAAPQTLATDRLGEPIGSKAEPVPKAEAVPTLADSDDLLGNPFPELSESKADGTPDAVKPATIVKSEEAEESNPFTGLKLEADAAATAVQQTAADSLPLPQPDLPAPAELAAPDDAAPAGKLPEITPAEKPVVKSSAPGGAHSEKLRKIAERSELTGLKGFCAVVLRDSRELKDVRPSFQAEFNGHFYNFSSEEALDKFKADPEKYAPAAAGTDVVLAANEGTNREGSLDRAVWYRNKLYLFSSKDSHEEFVASPSKFAVDLADDE